MIIIYQMLYKRYYITFNCGLPTKEFAIGTVLSIYTLKYFRTEKTVSPFCSSSLWDRCVY